MEKNKGYSDYFTLVIFDWIIHDPDSYRYWLNQPGDIGDLAEKLRIYHM